MARRSKYKLASLSLNDTIKVEGIDVYSLKNSLAGFNKRNKTNIIIEQIGDCDKGFYTFKRTL